MSKKKIKNRRNLEFKRKSAIIQRPMGKNLIQKSDVTIPGRAVTSTIQTMKSLGSIGVEASTDTSDLIMFLESKPDLVRRVKNIEENIIDIQKNIEQMQQYFDINKNKL